MMPETRGSISNYGPILEMFFTIFQEQCCESRAVFAAVTPSISFARIQDTHGLLDIVSIVRMRIVVSAASAKPGGSHFLGDLHTVVVHFSASAIVACILTVHTTQKPPTKTTVNRMYPNSFFRNASFFSFERDVDVACKQRSQGSIRFKASPKK